MLKVFKKPIALTMDDATEASIDSNQDSGNENHSGNEIEIIRSLSNLADIVVRLQGVIDEKWSRSHSLLHEKFELKSQQISIDDQLSQAQRWRQSLSNAYSKTKRTTQPSNRKKKHLLYPQHLTNYYHFFGVIIGKNRSFISHVPTLCKTTNQKLHALSRISNYVDRDKLRQSMKVFLLSLCN